MSKDSSRLSRLGVLAPAALSGCMDALVLAAPAAGAIVSTVLKELSKAFILKKWFHGTMSAKEAEHLMMEKGKSGSFLVRESEARPGEFVLSVRVRSRVSHVMIRRQHNKYDVGNGEQFDDLVGLIEHFRAYPMVETSGNVLRLLQPVSGTRMRAHNIGTKVQEMQKLDENIQSRCGFDGEFQSLKQLEERLYYVCNEGMKPENIKKNRYRNVLPYDHTRVVLSRHKDEVDTDYINASYIRTYRLSDSASSVKSSNESLHSVNSLLLGSDVERPAPLVSKSLSDEELRKAMSTTQLKTTNCVQLRNTVKDKVYIATQGCLSNTVDDFWRMIWQEDVRIVVMITNETEKGKKKCERYWPEFGHQKRYDKMTVRCISEMWHEHYVVRDFDVNDGKTSKTISQYQFTTWADQGTPEDTREVLNFINEINRRLLEINQSEHAPHQNMICVHCSAGVGRTGSFIVLDMLIDKIIVSGFNCGIDVHDAVRTVRTQRAGMVQNKAQYRFIYLALQDYITSKNLTSKRKVYTSEA